MSRIRKRGPQTVRPRACGGAPVGFCLLMFGLTAVVVYRWGHKNWTPVDPRPTYTATACVISRPASASANAAAANAEARIPMRFTDGDPQRAAQSANEAAERYVRDRRAEWKRCTDGPCLLAHETATKTQRERVENTARLETFRRQLAEAAEARAAAERNKPLPPLMVDNPQWLDLDRQLAAMQQRHDQLLVDRTPFHPAVRELAERIEGVRDQLAATPRQIPDTKPRPVAAPVIPDTPAISPADQATLDALTAAVERSRQACEEAASVEKKALEEQQTGPQFAVEKAQVVENRPLPDYGWRRSDVDDVCRRYGNGVRCWLAVGGGEHRAAGGQQRGSAGRRGDAGGRHDPRRRSPAGSPRRQPSPVAQPPGIDDDRTDPDYRLPGIGNLGRGRDLENESRAGRLFFCRSLSFIRGLPN